MLCCIALSDTVGFLFHATVITDHKRQESCQMESSPFSISLQQLIPFGTSGFDNLRKFQSHHAQRPADDTHRTRASHIGVEVSLAEQSIIQRSQHDLRDLKAF